MVWVSLCYEQKRYAERTVYSIFYTLSQLTQLKQTNYVNDSQNTGIDISYINYTEPITELYYHILLDCTSQRLNVLTSLISWLKYSNIVLYLS